MVGFVIGHMLGHLQMFGGAEMYNNYAHKLQSLGALLWAVRGFLILCLLLHVIATINLNGRNKAANPQKYKISTYMASTFSARFMAVAGLTILAFVIYHLLHFTVGAVHSEIISANVNSFDLEGHKVHNVYAMMVQSFSNPAITAVYCVAMLGLGIHLFHGIKSMFQTLGISGKELTPKIEKFSKLVAILIILGYLSVPITIFIGGIK